jgi:hypothetical protein
MSCTSFNCNGLINGSFGTGATGSNGTGISWNNQGGSGGTDFFNFAQGGTGGFFYYIVSSTHGSSYIAYLDSGGTFRTVSDYRIKSNVQTLDTQTTLSLNPVSYILTENGLPYIGFIAHELQEYFPELVTGEKDGEQRQTVNYAGLIPVLVKDIQRQQLQIDSLVAQVTNLTLNHSLSNLQGYIDSIFIDKHHSLQLAQY